MNIHSISHILVIVGALNWGMIGIFGINVVELLGPGLIPRIIYILVGLSAIIQLTGFVRVPSK